MIMFARCIRIDRYYLIQNYYITQTILYKFYTDLDNLFPNLVLLYNNEF